MADNKTIVRNYLEQAWMKHNHAVIDEYVAPDFVRHAPNTPPGREGVRAFFAMLTSAFSDLDYRVEDMLADGDKVCWRWELHAKHTGPFQGMPATGKSVTITGISIIRLANGKLVEHWGEQNMLGLMQQLRG